MDDKAVITYLARHYAGAIARRALWSLSGGDAAEIDYELPPTECWDLMWAKAGTETAPTRIGLVREMLFDAPGEESLLRYLEGLAGEGFKAEKELADLFLFLLAKTGDAWHRLPALLYLLRDMPPDRVLATIAPAIQATRDDRLYADLEKELQHYEAGRVTLSVAILLKWMAFYCDCLAGNDAAGPDTLEMVARVKASLAILREQVADAAVSGQKTTPDGDPSGDAIPDEGNTPPAAAAGDDLDQARIEKLEEDTARFKESIRNLDVRIGVLAALPPESGVEFFAPAVATVASLLELLDESGPDGAGIKLPLSAAKPVRDALWATR